MGLKGEEERSRAMLAITPRFAKHLAAPRGHLASP